MLKYLLFVAFSLLYTTVRAAGVVTVCTKIGTRTILDGRTGRSVFKKPRINSLKNLILLLVRLEILLTL